MNPIAWLIHGGGPCYIENSPLICSISQWTGAYMIGTSVMKEFELKHRGDWRGCTGCLGACTYLG